MTKRTKNETTKKIDRLNKKLKRGIAWARANGLRVRRGVWCYEGEVCPIGAYVAMKGGVEAAKELQKICDKNLSGAVYKEVAPKLGLDYDEVRDFVAGVDAKNDHSEFARLGVRLREKFAL